MQTPTTNNALRRHTIYVYRKHHIRFGRLRTDIYTLQDCQQLCTGTASCKGFDFCQDDLSCWTHDEKSENMDMAEKISRCNHYMVWRDGMTQEFISVFDGELDKVFTHATVRVKSKPI